MTLRERASALISAEDEVPIAACAHYCGFRYGRGPDSGPYERYLVDLTEGVPVQVHYAVDDPWVEAEGEVAPLGDAVRGAGAAFEEHVYPGSGHLFADPDFTEYDRASSEAMWERVIAFLDRIDAR